MRRAIPLLLVLAWPLGAAAQGITVEGTKHNLSVSGPGTIKAQSETQICIFCHVPHRGLALGVNRPMSSASYTPYNSTTLTSTAPGAPTGASRICLSCHDGTIALGQTVASGLLAIQNAGPGGEMPAGASNLGTDLRTTHPVSFLPSTSSEVHDPASGDAVKYDARGNLQCTSCHDPHRDSIDAVQKKFLVKSNQASAICQTCHNKQYWSTNPSSHQSSTTLFDQSRGAITGYTTVADNACESCHTSHGAGTSSRLLQSGGPTNCLKCHSGTVATKDLSTDFGKTYSHPVMTSAYSDHDTSESPSNVSHRLPETSSSQNRHVQCEDCHNPHASFQQSASAPAAKGSLAGTWGIDSAGSRIAPVQNEYELCFKCHADSANQPQALTDALHREIVDVNLRRRFDLTAPSFHPVEGAGRGTDVPSLISTLNTSSVIYCSDCHASDSSPGAGGTGPAGPHGSNYEHILERNYSTVDNTTESATAYALCYKCHDRTILMDSAQSAFPTHSKHVQTNSIPCSACHDSHGVSVLQGNTTNNAHLVNFDTAIVSQNTLGIRQYTAGMTPRTGTCSMSCHGKEHKDQSY